MARPVDPHRKEEVLEKAVAFLAEHGLTGFSMRKLAADLGVSTNVISYQFGSKEGLVAAALTRSQEASTEMLASLRAKDPDIRVADGVRKIWTWWRARPERFAYPRLSIEAIITTDDLEIPKRPDTIAFWNNYFTEWFVNEGRPASEAEELSSALNSFLSGLVLDMIRTNDFERVDRTLERFASLIEPNFAHRSLAEQQGASVVDFREAGHR